MGYFMGDIAFGSTLECQQRHLKELSALWRKLRVSVSVLVVRVCCVTSNLKAQSVKERLKELKEVEGVVYGRARMDVLRKYGLLQFDAGFFKYGLMLLDRDSKVLIHPRESMDVQGGELGAFAKAASCIISQQ